MADAVAARAALDDAPTRDLVACLNARTAIGDAVPAWRAVQNGRWVVFLVHAGQTYCLLPLGFSPPGGGPAPSVRQISERRAGHAQHETAAVMTRPRLLRAADAAAPGDPMPPAAIAARAGQAAVVADAGQVERGLGLFATTEGA